MHPVEDIVEKVRIVVDGYVADDAMAASVLGESLGVLPATGIDMRIAVPLIGHVTKPDSSYSIEVELLALPKERLLNERRRYLLHNGDAYVFVADCAPKSLPYATHRAKSFRSDLSPTNEAPIFVGAFGAVEASDDELRAQLEIGHGETLLVCDRSRAGYRHLLMTAVQTVLKRRMSAGTSVVPQPSEPSMEPPVPKDSLVLQNPKLGLAPDESVAILGETARALLQRVAVADSDVIFDPHERRIALALFEHKLIDGRITTSAESLERKKLLARQVMKRAVSRSTQTAALHAVALMEGYEFGPDSVLAERLRSIADEQSSDFS